MRIKRYILIMISVILLVVFVGCYQKDNKETSIKVYYNKNTIKSLDEMKILISEYEKEEFCKVELISVENEDEIKRNIKKYDEATIILLDAYSFLDFISNNYIRSLSYLYKEKNIREEFNIITNVYGLNRGKYYGIGFMPYSLELIYDEKMLEKLGVEVEENNIVDLIDKLAKKNIKIPSYIECGYSKEILFSSLIANDTIIYDLVDGKITSKLEDKIYGIKNGQIIMDIAKEYYDKGILKDSNFEDRDKSAIDDFNDGKVPILLTTTLASDKITDREGVYVVNKLPIQNIVNAPVGIDIIITSSIGNEKREEVDRFFRFLIQSDVFRELSKSKSITGNKYGDAFLNGVQSEMSEDIDTADLVNKSYVNIIDRETLKKIDKEMRKIMNGIYDGKEWSRIIKK